MARFTEADARRVLTFCLPHGYAVHIEDGADRGPCTIRIAPPRTPLETGAAFEGPDLLSALRAAAEGGVVRRECIERQIAFLSSFRGGGPTTSYDAGAGKWNGATPAIAAEPPPAPHEDQKVTTGHYRALAELRYQLRRFLAFSERAARNESLDPPQHQLLLAIRGLPPSKKPNLPTLAERMCLDVPACEALAASLLARGLVKWVPNPKDRREQLLALTPAARPTLRRLTMLHRNQMLSVGPTLVQVLGAILTSIEAPGDDDDED